MNKKKEIKMIIEEVIDNLHKDTAEYDAMFTIRDYITELEKCNDDLKDNLEESELELLNYKEELKNINNELVALHSHIFKELDG